MTVNSMVWIENKQKENNNIDSDIETDETRKNEIEIIERIIKAWKLKKYEKLFGFEKIDFSVYDNDNKLFAFIEVKQRNISIEDYPTIYFSKCKYDTGLIGFKNHPNAKFIFAIRTNDNKIYYIDFKENMQFDCKNIELSTDTNVKKHLKILIPTNLFQKLVEV